MIRRIVVAVTLATLLAPVAFAAEERRSTLDDQTAVAVTIYNDDLALIRDQRRVVLDLGENRLAFRDVSARIRPETALLKSLDGVKGFGVIEQNFDYDLLTPASLLNKYVGREVKVVRTHPQTGVESEVTATVLATSGGTVLKIGNQIETGIPGRIVFPDLPADLRDRPTLVTTVTSASTKPQQLELTYLSGGLSWRADYVALLAQNDATLDLSGWVTLTNQSGSTYRNARLQLLAGEVNRVQDYQNAVPAAMPVMARALEAKMEMQEEGMLEYHLYTVPRPTTLRENQTKQVALLSAAAVPARKSFELRGQDYYYSGAYGDLGDKLKIGTWLEFDNREGSRLGMPLPKGVVRVYKEDAAGNPQFVGEDRIDHTPKNEKIRLKLGDAFDLTAVRKQTDFKKLSSFARFNYVFESAYRIVLRNAKSEKVVVKVVEPLPGDWEIVKESAPHVKESATTAVWTIAIPPEGETVLEYRARVKY